LIVIVPIHPATPFNGYGARVSAGGNSPLRGSRGEIIDLRPVVANRACVRAASFRSVVSPGDFVLASAARTGAKLSAHTLRYKI